jgi:RNA polymerase sigma factor (sigma-70 family)
VSWAALDPTTKARIQATLTDRQQQVLTLHLAGCSQRRIATMLGISRTAVRDHLTTAVTALKEPAA